MAIATGRLVRGSKKSEGYRFSGKVTPEGVAGATRDNLIPLAVIAGAIYLFKNRKK